MNPPIPAIRRTPPTAPPAMGPALLGVGFASGVGEGVGLADAEDSDVGAERAARRATGVAWVEVEIEMVEQSPCAVPQLWTEDSLLKWHVDPAAHGAGESGLSQNGCIFQKTRKLRKGCCDLFRREHVHIVQQMEWFGMNTPLAASGLEGSVLDVERRLLLDEQQKFEVRH